MSKYYYDNVIKPLFELNLEIFNKELNENYQKSECLKFIEKIKLSSKKIKNFNNYLLSTNNFKKTKINKNELLINSEYVDISEVTDISKINEKFFEFNYNDKTKSTRNGTLSFTSCHKIISSNMSDLNDYNKCSYLISLSAQFIGCLKYRHLKRVLFFKLLEDIELFEIINCNSVEEYNSMRILLEKELTKLLLTDKFNSNDFLDKELNFTLQTNDSIPFSGFCNGKNSLPEHFIYYFLELYSMENKDASATHSGCIFLDTPAKSTCTNVEEHYKGFEFRIYNAHQFVKFEGLYCVNNNKFYLDNIINNYKINKKTQERSFLDDSNQTLSNPTKIKCTKDFICKNKSIDKENNFEYFYKLDNWKTFLLDYISFYKIINEISEDELITDYLYLCDIISKYCTQYRSIINSFPKMSRRNTFNLENPYRKKYLKYKKKYISAINDRYGINL